MKHPRLPSDWQLVPLSTVANVQTGLALGKEAKVEPVRLPYLRVANVQDGFLDLSEVKEVTVERSLIPRYSLRHGDVLMTEGGDFDKLGRGYIWHDEIPNCLHQNHVFVVRPNDELLSYFLASLTSSDYGRAYFQSCSKQSTNLASINSSQLKAFLVPLPTRYEQDAITRVLSTWDRGIRQLTDLIAAKLRFKQGLMQQLLTGKRRFKGFRGEWRTTQLKDIATINARTLPSTCDPVYEFRYIDLSSVTTGAINLPESSCRFGEAPSRARRIVRDRDILLATVRPNLKGFAQYRGDGRDIVCSTGFAVISANRANDSDYLWHLTLSDGVARQLESRIAGSNFPAVNASDVENLTVPFPPNEQERDQVSLVLSLIDSEVGILRKQLEALKQQKKGLMQKLLTGEIRVKLSKEVI